MAFYKAIRIEFVSDDSVPIPKVLSGGVFRKGLLGFVLSEGLWKKITGVFAIKTGAWVQAKD